MKQPFTIYKTVLTAFSLFTLTLLAACGGGGGQSAVPQQPTTEVRTDARILSCADCNTQQISALKQYGANVPAAPGNVVVTLSLTNAQYQQLQALLRSFATVPTNPINPPPPQTGSPSPRVPSACYLEYEYGRYSYDCDDDAYRIRITSTVNASARCYYEYDDGRREYECEDGRYIVIAPPSPPSLAPTPPTRDGQSPLHCYWDEGEYECYYSNGWECEWEHGRWECEREYSPPPQTGTPLPPVNPSPITPTPPQRDGQDPYHCYWDEGEYECYYRNGWECEWEYGRWECEREYSSRAYYQLSERGSLGDSSQAFGFVRGHLTGGTKMGNVRFMTDSEFKNVHLEHYVDGWRDELIALYPDFGIRYERNGQTKVYYGKITSVHSFEAANFYTQFSLGGVQSNYYENTPLRGYAVGLFLQNDVLWPNASFHTQISRPLSADEISRTGLNTQVRFGGAKNYWGLSWNSSDITQGGTQGRIFYTQSF